MNNENNELPHDLLDDAPDERPRAPRRQPKKPFGFMVPLAAAGLIGAALWNYSPLFDSFKGKTTGALDADKIAAALSGGGKSGADSTETAQTTAGGLAVPRPAPSALEQLESRVGAIESDLKSLHSKQDQQFTQLENLRAETVTLKTELSSYDSSINGLSARMEKLDKRLRLATRPATPKKPEAAPLPSAVALVSVRSYSGKVGITLRQNSEYSPMVLVGQSWRGWTLLNADPSSRQALVSASGRTQTLSL